MIGAGIQDKDKLMAGWITREMREPFTLRKYGARAPIRLQPHKSGKATAFSSTCREWLFSRPTSVTQPPLPAWEPSKLADSVVVVVVVVVVVITSYCGA